MAKAIRRGIRITVLSAAAVMVALGVMPSMPASAAVANQCVVQVTGEDGQGNFILGPMHCYSTYADVLRFQGATVPDSITPEAVQTTTLSGSAILGTHYDGTSWTGASFSVSGDLCSGGGLNVPLSWNDRISSTANGCNQIVHYNDTNYGGAAYDMVGTGGNLPAAYNNQTSSLKYFS